MQWTKLAVTAIVAAAWLATVAMLGEIALVLAVPAVLICMMVFL